MQGEDRRRAVVQSILFPSLAIATVDGIDALIGIDAVPREQGELSAPFLEYFVL